LNSEKQPIVYYGRCRESSKFGNGAIVKTIPQLRCV
jgi:hypothetical protein